MKPESSMPAVMRPLRVFHVCCLLLFAWLAGVPAAWAESPTDVILVLDNSGSMKQNDPHFLLKSAVSKFVAGLTGGTHAGIVIFDAKVNYAVPLGDLDVNARNAVKRSIDGIDYRGQYTNIPAAMERAIYELKSAGRKDASKIVVFMTDGIVDTGNAAVDGAKTVWLREDLAAEAAEAGIRIYGIAFTQDADFFLIQSLAKKTSGEYFRALKPEDLDGVFAKVDEKLHVPPPAPAAAAPTPAAPAPATPPASAATPAALGPCMTAASTEERSAYEEMAVAAKVTPEKMCTDLRDAKGGAVVTRPGDGEMKKEAAPEPPAQKETGVAMVVAVAAVVLAAIAGIVVVVLRKRGAAAPAASGPSARPSAPAAAANTPPQVPEAFIKDINRITGEPAIQIGLKPMMIGRIAGSDPDHLDYFVVDKQTIGRRHALIKYRDFGFWISDQGSVNGTFVNGERIENERPLKHGDRIRFHKYEFEFSMPEMDDGGHTVFADPSDRTVVAEAATLAAPASVLAGSAKPAVTSIAAVTAAAAAVAASTTDDNESTVKLPSGVGRAPAGADDDDAPTSLSARQRAEAEEEFFGVDVEEPIAPPAEPDEFDAVDEDDAQTILPVMAVAPAPAKAPSLSGTVARAEAEFDAEASAFFDEDYLGVTSSPSAPGAVNASPKLASTPPILDGDDFDDDEAPTQFATPPSAVAQAAPLIDDDMNEDFAEAVTVLPGAPLHASAADVGSETADAISLDEFMRTDSFETPLPGMADDDDDSATLLPNQVQRRGAPAIDDVFDLTAEGTIPPVRPGAAVDLDDGDDDDAPTEYTRR